jgi:hypothetical protein
MFISSVLLFFIFFESATAQATNCTYGDSYVVSGDIGNVFTLATYATCDQVIQLLASKNYDPVWFCKSSQINFGNACCQSCASKFFFLI